MVLKKADAPKQPPPCNVFRHITRQLSYVVVQSHVVCDDLLPVHVAHAACYTSAPLAPTPLCFHLRLRFAFVAVCLRPSNMLDWRVSDLPSVGVARPLQPFQLSVGIGCERTNDESNK